MGYRLPGPWQPTPGWKGDRWTGYPDASTVHREWTRTLDVSAVLHLLSKWCRSVWADRVNLIEAGLGGAQLLHPQTDVVSAGVHGRPVGTDDRDLAVPGSDR